MEMKSPPPCPNTVTVRRNPPRRARTTPSSAVPLSLPPSSKKYSTIRAFPLQEIISIDSPETLNPKQAISEASSSDESTVSENIKVFLRIKPIVTQKRTGGSVKNATQKNVWPQNPNKKKNALKTAKSVTEGKQKSEICLQANDSHSVTLCPPKSLQDVRRIKTEVYEGFSHVFGPESSQSEVYEKMVNPLVEEFLNGKSGMVAALGPSGSGKTHTVFGSARDPGVIPLALRRIFSTTESSNAKCSRIFHLSMFEIYSERGKGERILDLSQDGGDLYMQQANIKGLQEIVIHDVQQAEALIASGMLKRSTAMTNSNIQSSRSQCIINIRSGPDNNAEECDAQSSTAVLTIVDLAGAEREKRTGNQGARLLESNFINNTSMVLGLCLRSLLEHQKNPKKPLRKHFQGSLLTKYLREFLEGKKRMTLILTAKSGEEDYQDTSFLLRQASPYMSIKFDSVEEQPSDPFGSKRQLQTLPKVEQLKRMKISSVEVCMNSEVKGGVLHQVHEEELTRERGRELEIKPTSVKCPEKINEEERESAFPKAYNTSSTKKQRENQIILHLSRALWNALKECKSKLQASENEVDSLRYSLTIEKERCSRLENELNFMKACCSCGKTDEADVFPVERKGFRTKLANGLPNLEVCQSPDVYELSEQVFPPNPMESECFKEKQISDDATTSVVLNPDCFSTVNIEEHNYEVKAEVSPSRLCESESLDHRLVSDYNDVGSCANIVYDKDSKELEEREINRKIEGDTLESAVSSPESLVVLGAEISSSENIDQIQQKEEEKDGVFCPNVVNDKDFKELEDRVLKGEIEGCYTLESDVDGSESLVVLGDEISSSVGGDSSQQEEEMNFQVSSSRLKASECNDKLLSETKEDVFYANVVYDKDFKKLEEKDASEEMSGCDTLESAVSTSESFVVCETVISSSVDIGQTQKEKEEIPDPQEDANISKVHNARKVPKVEADVSNIQPTRSSKAAKPKRRLQPASSILLRNINSLDFDDANDKPKGTRGEKRGTTDVTKRTQGSNSLLHILKSNLHA